MDRLTFFLLLLPLVVYSQSCNQFHSCGECNSVPECGWCAPTQACLPGEVTGPDSQYGLCEGPAWEWKVCKSCATMTCQECRLYSSDCQWCQSRGQCEPISIGNGCDPTWTCPCDSYATCSECLDDFSCGWCSDNSGLLECVSKATNCTQFVASCGACEAHNDCESCRLQDGCSWCSSGVCKPSGLTACEENSVVNSCEEWCDMEKSCSACSERTGCAWCALENRCVKDDDTFCGELATTCPDGSQCQRHTYCGPCLDNPYCAWCADTKSCQLAGDSCENRSPDCRAYCNQVEDCITCQETKGCGWCDPDKICVDFDTATCEYSTTCGKKDQLNNGGFDAGSFVGGMFLIIGILVIGAAAFIFYRWKTGGRQRIAYSELK